MDQCNQAETYDPHNRIGHDADEEEVEETHLICSVDWVAGLEFHRHPSQCGDAHRRQTASHQHTQHLRVDGGEHIRQHVTHAGQRGDDHGHGNEAGGQSVDLYGLLGCRDFRESHVDDLAAVKR